MGNENLTQEITEAMKALFDLTARIDERVKMLVASNERIHDIINSVEDKVMLASEKASLLSEKLAAVDLKTSDIRNEVNFAKAEFREKIKEEIVILEDVQDKQVNQINEVETRLLLLEKSSSNQEGRWKTMAGYALQTLWVILVCYLLYKLNLQTPPMP